MNSKILFMAILTAALTMPEIGRGQAVADHTAPTKKSFQYINAFMMGALLGKDGAGTGFSFVTTHGVGIDRWRMGLGVGYDSYREWRAIPFVAFVAYDLIRVKGNALYVQMNGGYAEAFLISSNDGDGRDDSKGGRTLNPMIGYRISTEKFSIYLAAGYKHQQMSYSTSYIIYDWNGNGALPPNSFETRQTSGRLVIQLGFGLH